MKKTIIGGLAGLVLGIAGTLSSQGNINNSTFTGTIAESTMAKAVSNMDELILKAYKIIGKNEEVITIGYLGTDNIPVLSGKVKVNFGSPFFCANKSGYSLPRNLLGCFLNGEPVYALQSYENLE
ncbi:MAG: hypothetical protein AABX19_01615 [Nanoarchaeota archaeon]